MNCRRVQKLLPLHAGRDLHPAERAVAVEAHLASCASCAAELRRLQRAQEALRAAFPLGLVPVGEDPAPPTAGPRLAAARAAGRPGSPAGEASGSIWEALAPRLAAVDAAARLQRPWYRRGSWLSAAAAVLLVAVLVPAFLSRSLGRVPSRDGGTAAPGGAPWSGESAQLDPAGAAPGDVLRRVPEAELRWLIGSFEVQEAGRRDAGSGAAAVPASRRQAF